MQESKPVLDVMHATEAPLQVVLVVDDERDRASLGQVLVRDGLSVTACDRFGAPEFLNGSQRAYVVIDLIDKDHRDGIDFRGDRHGEGVSTLSLVATAKRLGHSVIAVVRPEAMPAAESARLAGAKEVVPWMGPEGTGAAIARIIAGQHEEREQPAVGRE